jgi:hypothetical protein
VRALIRQVAAVWPMARPVHLVGDRGFPSRALLLVLRQVRWGWTQRLRATTGVTLAGQYQPVHALLAAHAATGWSVRSAQYGGGPQALPGRLVIGRGLAVLPWHQHGRGSLRARAAQFTEHVTEHGAAAPADQALAPEAAHHRTRDRSLAGAVHQPCQLAGGGARQAVAA